MRLLGAYLKKTNEKPTASGYAVELKRLNSVAEMTIRNSMHGFHMTGFQ